MATDCCVKIFEASEECWEGILEIISFLLLFFSFISKVVSSLIVSFVFCSVLSILDELIDLSKVLFSVLLALLSIVCVILSIGFLLTKSISQSLCLTMLRFCLFEGRFSSLENRYHVINC
jgi:hypothetical protein